MLRFAITTALLAMAGCQSATNTRMEQFLNMDMAEFSARTGWVPSTYIPTTAGRTYVVDGPTVMHVSPGFSGNYIRTGPTLHQYQCRLLLETESKGKPGTADNWVIKAVNWYGTC